jgi:hypothetical protein
MVHCSDATTSYYVTKVWGEVLAHFHAVAIKHHSNMWNWLSGLPGWIFCEQSLRRQENDEHALDFALLLSHLFQSRWVWTFRVQLMLSSPNACLITASVSVTLFQDFHKILCCSKNHIRPDTQFQIKGCKKSARLPSSMKFCTLISEIC